jgi:polysaccharide deacetylase family protein (PEP-CTERM system associated)
MMRNALSVDVEDWFHVGAFENVIERSSWDGLDCRVERNTDRVLNLFEQAGVKGTFFTLAWVAERYPALIRRIADTGHEIASHGCDHARVFTMTPEVFLGDVQRSKTVLEQVSGQIVTGYRAPSFSIDKRTPWAHPALAEAGYLYSSSVAPVVHDHYGWPEAPRFAFKPLADSDLIELPVTTARFCGRTLAAGGGGFFRMLPYGFSRWAVRQVNAAENPAIIYFHPWEIDPDQPRVAGAPLKSRLRHYTNLAVMADKLTRLITDFSWGRVDAVAAHQLGRLA